MNDIIMAVKFAYRHTIRSGRSGFLNAFIIGIEVMEVEEQDLALYGFTLMLVFVVTLTYIGEWLRLALS